MECDYGSNNVLPPVQQLIEVMNNTYFLNALEVMLLFIYVDK